MSTPTAAEIAALEEAGPLLRFAAEHVDQLDPKLSLAIAEAIDASQNGHWTPAVSQQFWQAFAELCTLIKPVTMDCLAAAHRNVPVRSWIRFWRRGQSFSIAERTSSRYVILLFVLLAVVTPLQFDVWVLTNLSRKLDAMVADLAVGAAQVSAEKVQLPALPQDHPASDDQLRLVTRLNEDANQLRAKASSTLVAANQLAWVVSPTWTGTPASASARTASPGAGPELLPPEQAMNMVDEATATALRATGNANLLSAIILSFLLPILFGAIGAVAYVIRTISDQIRSTTFSSSSPIRHLMRVMLGALMGVVIGLFSGLSSQLSLPPLALAFLAGYGVEAVFSMFDGLVERFRQPAPTASGRSPQAKPTTGAAQPVA